MAIFRISAIGTPLTRAHEVLAPLVECAVNLSVSTPATLSVSFLQYPIVAGHALLKGFLDVINTTGLGEPITSTRGEVISIYITSVG